MLPSLPRRSSPTPLGQAWRSRPDDPVSPKHGPRPAHSCRPPARKDPMFHQLSWSKGQGPAWDLFRVVCVTKPSASFIFSH